MQHLSENYALLGTFFQMAGISLVALLSLFLTRSIDRPYLRYWSFAWATLAVGLLAHGLATVLPFGYVAFEGTRYLGHYAFGYLLFVGCRAFSGGAPFRRLDLLFLAPAAAIAFGVVLAVPDPRFRLIVEAGVLVTLFLASLVRLERSRGPERSGQGLSIMRVTLMLLTLGYIQYIPVAGVALANGEALPVIYRDYRAVYELLLEMLLAIGTVVLVMEDVRREAESANAELRAATLRLEQLARTDPLTESLNRHAFYSLVESDRDDESVPSGCVCLLDIDNLKPLNDTLGHSAGDDAIRAVSKAIRSVVRPDDLVFRWGGDEFLAVLYGVTEAETRGRLNAANEFLKETRVRGADDPIVISVSFGVAGFSGEVPLERAIEFADDRLLDTKRVRQGLRGSA